MRKVSPKLNSQSGVSLVELLVVIIVIAIVASMALLQRGSANEQFQRQNGSRQLKVAFERARFDSVKRRAQPPSSGDDPRAHVVVNADSFVLWVDTDGDGMPEASEAITTPLADGVINARYDSGSLPVTVTFSMRGEVVENVSQFRVCNGTCASPSNATSDIVLVTPTGTVNLLPGGSTIPTFSNPSVSTAAAPVINSDAILP